MQEFLSSIKQEVKKKISLEKTQEKITDNLIIPILNQDNNFSTNEKKCYYIKLYSALYFNNLALLNYLNNNNFSFGIYPNNLSIYLLDNSFTKYFSFSSYLAFITRYKPYLHSFFLSIKDLKALEKEEYIKRFIVLTTSLDSTLNALKDNHQVSLNNLFTKTTLDTFTNTSYKQASLAQLNNVIAPLTILPNKNTIIRLNNLIPKNFTLFCHNYDLMFSLFSDDELVKLTTSPEYFFTKALALNLDITRVLNIYKHNPKVINNTGILNQNIFNNYSDDEIIYLSKTINFYSSTASKDLKKYNRKRRLLSLLPTWSK